MFKSKFALLASAGLFAFSLSGHASDSADDLKLGLGGSFVCGGGHFSTTDFTTYSFRNINEAAEITIDRIRLFDNNGVLVFDSSVSALPTYTKTTLPALQSTSVNTSDIFGATSQINPMQMHVDWTSIGGVRALSLYTGFVRGTSNGGCRMTSLRTR